MNLRKIDLNLLVFFDALMRTRHVSRAAAEIGVGQPAMSSALGRLRDLFGDPLLVRQGNEMIPTERAMELEAEVRNILRDVEHAIEPPGEFDPQNSERAFSVRMSDLLTSLLMEELVQRMETDAPNIKLKIDHLSPNQTTDALARDKIDAAISTGLEPPKSVRISKLSTDSVVCIARSDLSLKKGLQNAEAFSRLAQVRVSQSPLDQRFADMQLGRMGLSRNVLFTVPHWLTVPDILCSSTLVAVVPRSFALNMADKYPLQIHPLPFLDAAFEWSLYWHDRYNDDPAHKWFRRLLEDIGKRQFDLIEKNMPRSLKSP